MTNLDRVFQGTGDRHKEPLPSAWENSEPYSAEPELIEAINLALYLRRPLLLEGEPGSGKTRLAYAVAYELGYPLKTCYIRSTSRAQELLYTYDAVARLYDIQEAKPFHNPEKKVFYKNKEAPPRQKYISYGDLGEAIKLSEKDIPSVVLIDEIDKADIDFPNDLLLVLDRLEFQIQEVSNPNYNYHNALKGQTASQRRNSLPLIIITSNREKELPKPFLRRCLFHYIKFPSKEGLEKIVERHHEPPIALLFQEAVKKFLELREQEIFTWRKLPSTSELLDWIKSLEHDEQKGKIDSQKLAQTKLNELPHLETLVKNQSDRDFLNSLTTNEQINDD